MKTFGLTKLGLVREGFQGRLTKACVALAERKKASLVAWVGINFLSYRL
jgi:hypothetical protein